MRRTAIRSIVVFFLVAAGGNLAGQKTLERKPKPSWLGPRIASIAYQSRLTLVVTGTALPSNQTSTMQRLYRLRAPAAQGGSEDVYYIGQPSEIMGAWTSTRQAFMVENVPLGRTFTIGVGEKAKSSPNTAFALLSNEVECFVPIEINGANPSPVPLGTSEIQVWTSDPLAPLGTRVVKFGGKTATLTAWNSGDYGFRVRVPQGLVIPGYHELWVQAAGGKVVSTKLRLRFLGPDIH